MTTIGMQGLVKRYGSVTAVAGVDLTVESGELFFLLGPSGCGKTTLLRMIAGFLEPSAGRLHFDGDDVTNLPANKRQTGMVFQSYALWPHMTVGQNVAYGLDVRKVPASRRDQRVKTALEAVEMGHLADRKPNALSGGQQQRVALARALVVEPRVVLLDEPLSNLDARLRQTMRTEIRRICKAHGLTGVYVTHDQEEALSMADRIAVLKDGLVQQCGTPTELYARPRTRFVAEFLGETNLLAGTTAGHEGEHTLLDTPLGQLKSASVPSGLGPGQNVTCSIRPEAFRQADDGLRGGPLVTGTVQDHVFLGERSRLTVRCGAGDVPPIQAVSLGRTAASAGDQVRYTVDPTDVVVLTD